MRRPAASGFHVNAEVPRDAVEQAVLRVEPVAILLPERQRRQQRVERVKLVIAERLHRVVERDIVHAGIREARKGEAVPVDFDSEPRRVDTRLGLDRAERALRFAFLRQRRKALMRLQAENGADRRHFFRLARAGQQDFLHGGALVMRDIPAQRLGIGGPRFRRGEAAGARLIPSGKTAPSKACENMEMNAPRPQNQRATSYPPVVTPCMLYLRVSSYKWKRGEKSMSAELRTTCGRCDEQQTGTFGENGVSF